MSGNYGDNYAHPKSWVLETSNGGVSWAEVDHRSDNSDLKGTLLTKTFIIEAADECRMIRLRLTGKNHQDDDRLILSGFEVFGTLKE